MKDENSSVNLSLNDFKEMQTRAPSKKRKEYYKEVVEYTMDGQFITCYPNAGEASKATGLSAAAVQAMCKGRSLFSCKLNKIFLFRGDDIDVRLKDIEKKASKATHREVYEYSLKGRFIGKYPTTKEAAKHLKVSPYLITKCCTGKRTHINNKILLYAGNKNIKERVKIVNKELAELKRKRVKYREVDEYTLDGKFVKAFPSASAVAREYGYSVPSITQCCKGLNTRTGSSIFTTYGKIFLWVGDSISDRLKQIEEYNNERQRLLSPHVSEPMGGSTV